MRKDRLPTVTASAALDELENAASPHISTGLADLDAALATASPAYGAAAAGVKRGQVTEVWGPPGTGKTALGCVLCLSLSTPTCCLLRGNLGSAYALQRDLC